MKFTIRKFFSLLILIAAGVAIGLAMFPQSIDVEVAQAMEASLRVTVREDGKTRIREKYVVSAPVSGRLSRIKLKEGDVIDSENTLIAVILPSEPAILDVRARAEARARVHAAEASLRRAIANTDQSKITLEMAEINFRRIEKLRSQQAVSQTEYDQARSEFLSASQQMKTSKFESEIAQFELEMAQAAVSQFARSPSDDNHPLDAEGLAHTSDETSEPFEIFAPVSGKVLRVFQESSTVVSVGTPLLEIGDPKNLEIEIDVLSSDATQIRPGAEVTIDHWGGQSPLKANVRVVEPAAFTKISALGVEEQRVNVIADFDEPVERIATLGDGYRVEAKITIDEQPQVLQIPNSALFRYQRQWHVMRVLQGQANLQSVETGLQNESSTQILSGLQARDRVILYPSDQIQDGTRVRDATSSHHSDFSMQMSSK